MSIAGINTVNSLTWIGRYLTPSLFPIQSTAANFSHFVVSENYDQQDDENTRVWKQDESSEL